ncbi:bifunctional 4-hydroxy-2-oxoglutarate aldolase/2-dehydro-3-deoxy-phosphogluconate aldolase [Deinococcus frigens]|uniref:bifunctional 4-hydroxy-2-oxoglutarate aldolase/2-dehydro-3-deoxy-phosphogluconate aldolase n=1 Tax=Deinococcus frigens TaxID=249403 RepID=UPI000A5696A6|nr:bifunctional 4-hydroxy-2-oxoglutarate aldolase/2-dehydro-3-deoxy-phosphogluconate aldolase [Deinococcus frigens]
MTLERLLARDRVLPLFTPDDLGVARDRLNILQTAGVGVAELTARAPGALEHFKTLQTEFPGLLLGAGTILTAADAHAYADAGAAFLVSPCLVPEVAAVARERGLPYLPGAGTVREYLEARDAGCGLVKLFPGEVLGPPFVRALTGPFPDAQVIVTGGVEATRAGVAAWLDAGALAVGLGSRLFEGSGELDVRLSSLLDGCRRRST